MMFMVRLMVLRSVIKEEEDEADYYDDYEQWRSQSEKEDAQIDEMFGALRWN